MKYELSFIISPAIPETEHPNVNQEILDYLKGLEAKVTREPYFMGRRKLAYAINKQKHGFYVCLEFETEQSSVLKDLDTKLKHNNSLLRYLVIRLESNRKEGQTIDFAKMEERDRARSSRPKISSKTKKTPMKSTTPSRKTRDENKEKGKVKFEDIDKKLDEILSEPKVD